VTLDLPTTVFITSLVFASQTIAFLVQYRVNRDIKGLGWWLGGAILQALGFFLMLALGSPSVHLLSIFANPLIFAGQVCIYVGIARFLELRERRWVFIALLASYMLCYFYFIFIESSMTARAVVVSASAALVALLMSGTLFGARKSSFSGSAVFTASVFLAFGLAHALIAALTCLAPRLRSYADLGANPVSEVAFIIPTIGSMLWTFGFIIMVNQRLNAENLEEREKLQMVLKEVHHRIKNNMNTMMSLLDLQAGNMDDSISIGALEDASKRLQSMATLYEKLYQSTGFTRLSVKTYLPSLVDEILANFSGHGQVRVEKDVDDFPLDADRLQPLGIVVNELLTNVMKYAFAGRDEGKITIAAKLEAGQVTVIVQDDGVGLPDSVDAAHSPGFGLMLVQALTAQLQGSFRLERGQGTKAVLRFGLSSPTAQEPPRAGKEP
jgi:two-component sensor histidine kinase